MTNEYETTLKKDAYKKWVAETMVNNINGYDWLITTSKWDRKGLICNAQACQETEHGFTFTIFQDPSIKLYQVEQRGTEKTIETAHKMGLLQFDKLVASGELPSKSSTVEGN